MFRHVGRTVRVCVCQNARPHRFKQPLAPAVGQKRSSSCTPSTDRADAGPVLTHFRNTPQDHPLGVPKKRIETDVKSGEWINPTINHVWSAEEIKAKLSHQPRHQPETWTDHAARRFLRIAYWCFNKVTRYNAPNPSADSVAFRLIFLESVAAVPGMVAAQHRHFRSLRTLSRDYGWIHTLLEEAENERMHLLTFLQAFTPGLATRSVVFLTQFGFGGLFIVAYIAKPAAAHRLVGYIEEMAVVTYTNIIEMMETPGTKLNVAWGEKKAPDIAKMYWRLDDDATFLDVIKQVAVDETNHRDVNHTFASMARDDPNPYVSKHLKDAGAHVSHWYTSEGNTAVEGKELDFDMTPRKPISTSR